MTIPLFSLLIAALGLAVYLWQRARYERVIEHKRSRQISLLNDITRAALETSDFHQMLQTLADRSGELIDADGCYLTLWNEANQQTIPVAAYGTKSEVYATLHPGPGEVTLTASVLRAGHALTVEDIHETLYISSNVPAIPGASTRSLLGLPLIADGQKLGAALIAFDELHHFTPDEIALSEQAARQIALALAKSRLLDETRHYAEDLRLLFDATRDFTAGLAETDVLRAVARHMANAVHADGCTISRWEPDRDRVITLMNYDGASDSQLIPPGTEYALADYPATRRVLMECQPLLIDTTNPTTDPAEWALLQQYAYSALLMLPLVTGEQAPFGLIKLTLRPGSTLFSAPAIQLAQSISAQAAVALENAQLYAKTQHHLNELHLLHEFGRALSADLSLDAVLNRVADHFIVALGVDSCTISSWDIEHNEIVTLLDRDPEPAAQVKVGSRFRLSDFPKIAVELWEGRSLFGRRSDPNLDEGTRQVFENFHWLSALAVPLMRKGRAIGLVELGERHRERVFRSDEIRLAESLASQATVAIENARLHAEAQALATTDGLTGLANRRAFDSILQVEQASAARYGHPLSLILLDIDAFKEYNDTYGHPAGDERLRTVAEILRANLRAPDVAARYGGDEFALVLPHTGKAGAMALAERLRIAASATTLVALDAREPTPGYTLSLGVATFPADTLTPNALLLAADNALLAAKREGKNRIRTAPLLSRESKG